MNQISDPVKELVKKVEEEVECIEIQENDEEDDSQSDHDRVDSGALVQTDNDLVNNSTNLVFDTVTVTNSQNVQFGNNTIYNGPVTFKIINGKEGIDNAAYIKSDEEGVENDTNVGGTDEKSVFCLSIKKIKVKTWFQWSLLAVCIVTITGICVLLPPNGKTISDYLDYSNNSTGLECSVKVYFPSFKLIFAFILVAVLCYFLLTYEEPGLKERRVIEINDPNPDEPVIEDTDNLLIAPEHLRIVERSDWLAQPPLDTLDDLRLPAPWVIISHTATESCKEQKQCVLRVRLIQDYHIGSRNWFDIGYNFLVGGDGSAYCGRGWDYVGAHTKGYNKYSIGIAFIGTFTREVPPQRQLDACMKLIELGVKKGKIAKDYKLLVHRQLMSTESPGTKLVEIIKKWPHFVKTNNIEELLPNY